MYIDWYMHIYLYIYKYIHILLFFRCDGTARRALAKVSDNVPRLTEFGPASYEGSEEHWSVAQNPKIARPWRTNSQVHDEIRTNNGLVVLARRRFSFPKPTETQHSNIERSIRHMLKHIYTIYLSPYIYIYIFVYMFIYTTMSNRIKP